MSSVLYIFFLIDKLVRVWQTWHMKVLITGASSGIGRELAKLLAAQFDQMVLVGRDQARLNALQQKINQTNSTVNVTTVSMDLSVAEHCQQLHAMHPDVDLLINNAGFGDSGLFAETALAKDLAMINTNVVALHVLTKLYLATMQKRNCGHILNVGSIAGFMPGPLMATYYATKNYVVRLSEGIREELRRTKSKVKISVLCPGPVDTNFAKTANVQFNFRGVSCAKVAQYTVRHLHQFYIVPTWQIRLARFAMGLLPSTWVARIVYRIQAKRQHC